MLYEHYLLFLQITTSLGGVLGTQSTLVHAESTQMHRGHANYASIIYFGHNGRTKR